MKLIKSLLVLSAFTVIFGGIFATAAIAQSPEGSSLRLEQPLEIGGTVLEPGVYMITVVPGDRRDVLKVTGEDGTETFARVLTTPHAAAPTADQRKTQYVYFATTAGSDRVLKTWFAPDSATGNGYDIVYPERRAMELATVANGPVVAYKDGTVTADLTTTELEVVSPNKEVLAYVAPDDTEEPVEVAETPSDRPTTASEQPDRDSDLTDTDSDLSDTDSDLTDRDSELSDTDSELPSTASLLPLLVALGFLLLLAAGGIRILHKV